MRSISTILLSLFLLMAQPVVAGPGHDHEHGHSHGPVSKQQAMDKAAEKVKDLVSLNKIEQSWLQIKAGDAIKKDFGKGDEWVIIFTNSAIKDKERQNLYIFFSLDGHYLAANHTGE